MSASAKIVQVTTAVAALLNSPPVAFFQPFNKTFVAKRAYRTVSDLKDKVTAMLVTVIGGDSTGNAIDDMETDLLIPVAVVIQAKVSQDLDCDQYMQLAEEIQQTLEGASFAPPIDAHWSGDTKPGVPNPDHLEKLHTCTIASVVNFRCKRLRTFSG